MALATIFSARSALCIFCTLAFAGSFPLSPYERASCAKSTDFGSVFAWGASQPQQEGCRRCELNC